MLNYIWLALIALGITVAIAIDISDQTQNKYRNNDLLEITIPDNRAGANETKLSGDVEIKIDGKTFSEFYDSKYQAEVREKIKISFNEEEKKYSFYLIVNENPRKSEGNG
jgi:hypothetical protein